MNRTVDVLETSALGREDEDIFLQRYVSVLRIQFETEAMVKDKTYK